MNRIRIFLAAILCGTVAFASRDSSPPASAENAIAQSAPQASAGDSTTSHEYAMMMDAHNQLASQVYAMKHDIAALRGEPFSDCVPLDDAGEPIIDPEEYFPGKSDAVADEPTYELLLFTPSWFHCDPCDVAKNDIVPWIEEGGLWTVTVCESDEDDGIRSFPTWAAVIDGVEVHRWTGADWSQAGRADIHANLNKAKGINGPVLAATPTSNSLREWIADHYGPNDWGNWTHPDTIYNHLIDGHGWSASDLEGLTNREMNCLHDACHEGRISASGEHHESTPAPRAYASSNCPNGRCPAPARRGPFRRLFNF